MTIFYQQKYPYYGFRIKTLPWSLLRRVFFLQSICGLHRIAAEITLPGNICEIYNIKQ